jgi:hypothetical protein
MRDGRYVAYAYYAIGEVVNENLDPLEQQLFRFGSSSRTKISSIVSIEIGAYRVLIEY